MTFKLLFFNVKLTFFILSCNMLEYRFYSVPFSYNMLEYRFYSVPFYSILTVLL